MKRRIVGALSALALATVGVAVAAVPASATPLAHMSSAFIKSSPDDGCPVWARDSFTRTTKIVSVGDGKYKVTIGDKGTFVTNKGAASPGAPATPIANKVEGSIVGSGEFVVTGTLKSKSALNALPGFLDNSGFACKDNVPADRKTGNWPLRYFEQGATTPGIVNWTWTYETCREKRVESSVEGKTTGNVTGLLCDAKVKFEKPSCRDRDAELTVFNPNKFEAIQVGFGAAPAVTVLPGKSTKFEFHAGSVQVMVNGVAFGAPFVYQPPKHCKPVVSWAVSFVEPTCASLARTVTVLNDGNVPLVVKLGGESKVLKPGESLSKPFSTGVLGFWVNHLPKGLFKYTALVCPTPTATPTATPTSTPTATATTPPVAEPTTEPAAPGAGGGDSDSGGSPTLPETGELRSMWTTPTALSAYGVLIVLVGAALFVLNRRRKFVTEA